MRAAYRLHRGSAEARVLCPAILSLPLRSLARSCVCDYPHVFAREQLRKHAVTRRGISIMPNARVRVEKKIVERPNRTK